MKTCEVFLCFVANLLGLGSIMFTSLYSLLNYITGEPVYVTGSYTEDEPYK